MMSLKKLAAVAFMLVAASVQVEAQGGGGGGGGRGGQGGMTVERTKEMLFAGITLDAAQTTKVDSILTATAAKRAEVTQAMRAGGGGGDRQAIMAQMQEAQAAERTALRAVLTAAQQPIFDKNVENMPARGRRPPPMI